MTDPSDLKLPTAMSKAEERAAWTPSFQDAVTALVASQPADRRALDDFIDTVGCGSRSSASVADQVAYVVRHFTPAAVYYAWEVAQLWAATVSLPRLSDVIGKATAWDEDLSERAGFWLDTHLRLAQVIRMADLLGHLEVVATPYGLNWCASGTDFFKVVQPQELLRAWSLSQAEYQHGAPPPHWLRSWAKACGARLSRFGRISRVLWQQYNDEVVAFDRISE